MRGESVLQNYFTLKEINAAEIAFVVRSRPTHGMMLSRGSYRRQGATSGLQKAGPLVRFGHLLMATTILVLPAV